jgi:general secretion pathway protein N
VIWRWAAGGSLLGGACALLAFAPAAWLASAVAHGTGERLLLADARGSVWSGSAVMVLTGGIGSRDASALPGRLRWRLSPQGTALGVGLTQDCCINGEMHLRLLFGLGRVRVELSPAAGGEGASLGQWPAAWLAGLGTPWNTIQPSGSLQLRSSGLAVEQVQGRWLFSGRADLDMTGLASRLSTLDVLGSYRLSVVADATGSDATRVALSTRSGALQLSGNGQWVASRFHFKGQASAEPGYEAVLGSLLNIIGRRQGALSLISIG